MLTNVLIEMMYRCKCGEKCSAVDPQMLLEVSKKSLDLADVVVWHIGVLAELEKYVLSIYFEAAQNKI